MGKQSCGSTHTYTLLSRSSGASSRPPQVARLSGEGDRETLPVYWSGCNFGVNSECPNLIPDAFAGRFLVPAREKKEVDFLGRHPAPQSSLQGPLGYVDACVCTKGGGQAEPR